MPTEVRTAGPLTLGAQNAGPPTFAPTTGIVGSGSQWADDDDATYAVIGVGVVGTTSEYDLAWGTVPVTTFDPSTVDNVVVRARVKVNTVAGASGPEFFLGVRSFASPSLYETLAYWQGGFSFGVITDLVFDYQAEGDLGAMETVANMFTEPRQMAAHPIFSAGVGDHTLYLTTVYQASVEFTYGEAPSEPPAPEGLYLYDEAGQVLRPFNHIDNISTSP